MGPLTMQSLEYDFGTLVVEDDAGKAYPIRVLGVVHAPSESDGPYPVILVMHGRHSTCERDSGAGRAFELARLSHCRDMEPVAESIKSYRGHDDVAAILVSHGFVVVSVDTNDVASFDSRRLTNGALPENVLPNGDDGLKARAQLIMRTLDELQRVNERGGGDDNPSLDVLTDSLALNRLGLMGHSRGAEAVTRAPSFAAETGHWSAGTYEAIYSIGGTDRWWMPGFVAPVVPGPIAYASVLPYCDGDVWDLGNAILHDVAAAAPNHGHVTQLLFLGANHNYYNTEWPQDDAEFWGDDPYCASEDNVPGMGSGRLTPADQLRHHQVYLPSFFRWHMMGADNLKPLFTGASEVPTVACPGAHASCPGLLHVSYMPPARDVLMIEDASDESSMTTNDLGQPSTVSGFEMAAFCQPMGGETACGDTFISGGAGRLYLAWTGNATYRTELSRAAVQEANATHLSFRVGVDAASESSPPQIVVAIENAQGATRTVFAGEYSDALFVPPGTVSQRVVSNQVRIPLQAFALEPKDIRAIEILFDGSTPSQVHLSELMLYSS